MNMENVLSSRILDKIRKLMSLADNNSNLNESAAAFAQAQALLSKHRLTMAEVEAASETLQAGEQIIESAKPLYAGERVVRWKSYLASKIADLNSCKMFIRYIRNYYNNKKESRYVVVGRPSDIEIVEYLFQSISSQIEILCKNCMQSEGLGGGKTFANNFKFAAVETVVERLKAADQEAKQDYQGSAAMVLIKRHEAEVVNWMAEKIGKLKSLPASSSQHNSTAQQLGRAAGYKIGLNKAIKSSTDKGSGGYLK